MKLLVTGGIQRSASLPFKEWHLHKDAVFLALDTARASKKIALRYRVQARHAIGFMPDHLFFSASVSGEEILVGAGTEVVVLGKKDLQVRKVVSLPCFQNVHHALRFNGKLYVVSTGLDMVVVVDEKSKKALSYISALGEKDPWERFEPRRDYRLVSSTKPHRCHPNFLFVMEKRLWLTRFEQKDAVDLLEQNRRIDLSAIGKPHDGLVRGGRVYFTTTNGHFVSVDCKSLRVLEDWDLNSLNPNDKPLGWCRGIALRRDKLWIGFSALRKTRWLKNLHWVKSGFRERFESFPTRIVEYNLAKKKLVRAYPLDDLKVGAVFSIIATS